MMVAALTEAFEVFSKTGDLSGFRKAMAMPHSRILRSSLIDRGIVEIVDRVETQPGCFASVFYVHTSKIPA